MEPDFPPEFEELNEFSTEFNRESDRGAVLVAASIIDNRLLDILTAFFIESKTSQELLQGANAPLATFAARASAAFAMGLIQDDEYSEIGIIRKIRNDFGHQWRGVSFENQRVTQLCMQLPWRGPDELELKATIRQRFDFAVLMLITDLVWRAKSVGRERRAAKSWEYRLRP